MPSATMPERTGYIFNGYFFRTSGVGTQYYSSTGQSMRTWNVAADSRLYAYWTAKECPLKFNANGGTGTMPSGKRATYDQPMPAYDQIAPTMTGYRFNGYYDTSSTSGGKQYYTNGLASANTWDKDTTSETTLYARWLVNQYTATFVHNDGTGNTTQRTQDYGTELTAPTLTRPGYTLASWNPAVDSTMQAENKTYTAQWTANTYTVTFDKQDGTGGTDSTTVTYGQAMPTITLPTRTGYIFGGYYDGTNGTGTQYYTASGTSARTCDLTEATPLYAAWSVVAAYDLRIARMPAYAGTATGSGTHCAGDTFTITATATDPRYVFNVWSVDDPSLVADKYSA